MIICPLYPQIGHYLRVQPFIVGSENIVDFIECTHSIPHCTTIMSVQTMLRLFSFTPSNEQY